MSKIRISGYSSSSGIARENNQLSGESKMDAVGEA
jgi:hypothetical protein